MSAGFDLEWEDLSRAWGQVGAERLERGWIADLVSRQTRQLRLTLIFEIAVTVLVLGALAWWLGPLDSPGAVVIGLAALGHTGLVWAFMIWNRAGIWRPLGETTRDYLELALERCRRERRTARFVVGLLLVEAVLLIWWVGRADPVGERRPWSWAWLVPGSVFLGGLVWAAATERRVRRREARLAQVAGILGDEEASSARS